MVTKIEAAVIATGAGIPVLLAAATSVGAALQGLAGTYFHPGGDRTASRLFWLRHATTPRGRLTLDRGAIVAVVNRRASLLPAGIIGVSGDFDSGEPVDLVAAGRHRRGARPRWLRRGGSAALLGRKTGELPAEFRRESCTATISPCCRSLGRPSAGPLIEEKRARVEHKQGPSDRDAGSDQPPTCAARGPFGGEDDEWEAHEHRAGD